MADTWLPLRSKGATPPNVPASGGRNPAAHAPSSLLCLRQEHLGRGADLPLSAEPEHAYVHLLARWLLAIASKRKSAPNTRFTFVAIAAAKQRPLLRLPAGLKQRWATAQGRF